MTNIENIKVGDYVRITDTSIYEGKVAFISQNAAEVDIEGIGLMDLEEYGDQHSITIEVIEKPREIGWWEVEAEVDGIDMVLRRVYYWDGSCWSTQTGTDTPWDNIALLHYIGKGSFA